MAKFSQYQVFVAIVESGSLSAAARLLNFSPSAISKQLTALENRVNTPLFERSNRRLHVTESGQKFYQQCKQILSQITQAEESLLSVQGQVAGKLSITLSKSLANSGLFRVLSDFSGQYPAIRFDIDLTDNIVDLHEENIDFAFRLGRIEDSTRLIAKPLTKVSLVYCASPAYIEHFGAPDVLTDLSAHQVMLLSPKSYSTQIRQFIKREKIQLNQGEHHTTNDIEAVYQSVLSGLSIGMMLDLSVRKTIEEKKLINLFPDKTLISKKLYLVYKKGVDFSKKQTLFKKFVIEKKSAWS
ncbi:LysR family transcriptional regulator [bacterium AH-315-K03]|nr:LysR family transcriptional regulator [bacterium AH-315-K03]